MPKSSTHGIDARDLAARVAEAIKRHQSGSLDEAERLYRAALAVEPAQFDALHMLGILESQRGRFAEGAKLVADALKIDPGSAEAHSNYGRILAALGRREEALAAFDQAVAINPHLGVALLNRGALLRELGRAGEALAAYDRALAVSPGQPEILFNRANALMDLGRSEEALAALDAVIATAPRRVDVRVARANVLGGLRRHAEALAALDAALAVDPKNVVALANRGVVLATLGRRDEALAALNAAIEIDPRYANAYYSRGRLMMKEGLPRNATADFATALHVDGNTPYALGYFIQTRLQVCDWAGLDEARGALDHDISVGRPAAVPSVLAACGASAATQLVGACRFVADRYPAVVREPARRAGSHDKIRIAYVSADFREHAVASLAAGLLAQHDRTRFTTTAVSLAPAPNDAMQGRLTGAFDHFLDVGEKSDAEIVALMQEREIDIAVDLMGHTDAARTGIFAARAAPIQVNFLGYPGTMGADYVDYLIADRFVVPDGADRFYAEKVVRLPHTFMATDSTRPISARQWSRTEAGLPEQGLVFCAFGPTHKITPRIFDVWMRLLKQVDGSVLWLRAANDIACANLRREAEGRGVDAGRLVFAPRVEANDDHLARCRLADLYLDTPDCNAYATAADMLWAGVPVVTCAGDTFATRVGGSLLTAVGLPEMVTRTLADYEALALGLARDPGRLSQLHVKLALNRTTFPLFDTLRFVRDIEAAYAGMYERWCRGEAAQGFSVGA